MNYKIHEIEIDRWPEYKNLRLEALKEEPQAFEMEYEKEIQKMDSAWIERLRKKDDPANIRLFLEIDNKLVGMVSSYRPDGQKDTAEITNVYLKKEFRGLGLGSVMVKEIVNKLKTTDVNKLHLTVNANQIAAVKTYERLGFRTVTLNKDSIKHNNNLYDELEMQLLLEQ